MQTFPNNPDKENEFYKVDIVDNIWKLFPLKQKSTWK